jgi:hypothetical protein
LAAAALRAIWESSSPVYVVLVIDIITTFFDEKPTWNKMGRPGRGHTACGGGGDEGSNGDKNSGEAHDEVERV